MNSTLQQSVASQRDVLAAMLAEPLKALAATACQVWGDRAELNRILTEAIHDLTYCKFLYAVGPDRVQISDNVSHAGSITKDYGRDRSSRPYMRQLPQHDFILSDAYVSLRARRPSLSAVQVVRSDDGQLLGYIGADFDLRDLPITRELYEEPSHWRQMKGDPAIRGAVFSQRRSDSMLDRHIDEVQAVLEELIIDRGVFHVTVHFSSNRAVVYLVSDPYRYRLLDIDALIDPDMCLAYPRCEYPNEAVVPAQKVRPILERLRDLRFVDENLYLRAGSLNIFNGLVSLTFSCDGSHYVPWQELLAKDNDFWIGVPDLQHA